MKTGVIKRLAMRIKTIVATLRRRDEHFVNMNEENDWNEGSEDMITDEDILRDNLHNERLRPRWPSWWPAPLRVTVSRG